ncbi:MAG: hypothetical protein A3J74_10245 [Elusimicrobia bacterium RIFCSPHIGHO2_02_FULL_57_9]|nr:MAG: hypothetical protein A3J74_10245 [Elusimicrobia bacterium RIFCSPHIGHO2_02_FULL_57_9]
MITLLELEENKRAYRRPLIPELYEHLPGRNQGRFGRPGDALNIIFLGHESLACAVLESAGWTKLPLTFAACVKESLKELLRGEDLTRFPPMNRYNFHGRSQDMNWVRVIKPLEARHHFRLWRTGIKDERGRTLWWGSGNLDLTMRWIDFSHRPDPDMNLERDYLAETLRGSPHVQEMRLAHLPGIPLKGVNDKGYPFFTDGRALIIELNS